MSRLPPTFAIIIHIPRPCIRRPRFPVPHVPAPHTRCPQVPRLTSPSPKSPHTRLDVPVPLSQSHFFTQPNNGVPPNQIIQITGHKNLQSINNYRATDGKHFKHSVKHGVDELWSFIGLAGCVSLSRWRTTFLTLSARVMCIESDRGSSQENWS